MKITKSELKKIIAEEIGRTLTETNGDEFGKAGATAGTAVATGRAAGRELQTGVTAQERAVVQTITKELTAAAKDTNILSGQIKTFLMRIHSLLVKMGYSEEAEELGKAAAPEEGAEAAPEEVTPEFEQAVSKLPGYGG